jgi:hypothetical protein
LWHSHVAQRSCVVCNLPVLAGGICSAALYPSASKFEFMCFIRHGIAATMGAPLPAVETSWSVPRHVGLFRHGSAQGDTAEPSRNPRCEFTAHEARGDAARLYDERHRHLQQLHLPGEPRLFGLRPLPSDSPDCMLRFPLFSPRLVDAYRACRTCTDTLRTTPHARLNNSPPFACFPPPGCASHRHRRAHWTDGIWL